MRSAPVSSSMNDRSADVSSSQGRDPVAAVAAVSASSGARFTIAIGLTLRQQALGQSLTTTPPSQSLQWIVRHGDDPDGLAVVQPHQMDVIVYVVALANGPVSYTHLTLPT